MLMQAMADWYTQGDTPDQTRLVRILDVAQDLKVQSTVCVGASLDARLSWGGTKRESLVYFVCGCT